MFENNKNTSSVISGKEFVNIATITHEIKQHGFYSAYCDQLITHTDDHDALIRAIKALAARAEFRVTFNAVESICIFEAF